MMVSALSLAFVAGQAQGVAKQSPGASNAIQVQSSFTGETGDSFDPNFDPFTSQVEQKSIGGTDDVKIWVLPTNGATSGNTRAPGNLYKFQRTEYIITAAEIAASGFPSGSVVSSIGFFINAAGIGTVPLTGTLSVYLMNTTDVTYTLGATWTTAGFTLASSNPAFTVPISPAGLMYDETFVGGSPFTYTGGGVYVAWEFNAPAGTVGTGAVVHNCQNLLANSLYGNRSNTALPTALTASAFRPATRFGTTSYDDILAIRNVYTLGKVPVPFGTPTPVGIRVENVTALPATFDLILEVRDVATNTLEYTSTQSGIVLAGNTASVYNFTGWTPSTLEDVKVIALTSAVTGETWTVNNTFTELAQVNNNLYSYCYSNVPGSGYGYTTPNGGIFASKYMMNGSGIVPSINIFIYNFAANTGHQIFACILNSAGTIVAQSPNYTILVGDLGTNKTFTFATPPVFTNEEFFVGVGQTYISSAVQYYPLGIFVDNPVRANAFYNFALTGGTPSASTASWRYMIEAVVGAYSPCDPPSGLFASNITATTTDLNWTSLSGLSDVEYGPTGFVPTGTPTNAGVTSPLTVATAPATGYDFYVRDVCAGPVYSLWIGPKTFWTFCEDCPSGGIAEGEAQLPNGSDGSGINGGCAVGDPLLTLPIALGDTYCGQSNTFLNNLGAASRDNDYYFLDLSSPTCIYWHVTATIKGNGLYNMTLFNAGNMDCAISAYGTVTTTVGCELATIDVDVPSGYYYLVARVATATGGLWPYGSGPWQYVLTVNGSQLGAPTLNPVPPATVSATVPPAGSTTQNLSIGNSGSYPLDYAASTSGTYLPSFTENFDTYAAGVQLALQVGDLTKWTTWSNAPGSTEDPFVSTDVAFSGPNSTMITGVNDCVHPFPNYTTGSYKISFKMYVPTGFDGYFNTLQLFSGAASEWGMQAYFDAGGAGSCDAGGAASGTWTFSYDTWFNNELYIDLDGDYAEYWFDGTFIVSWQWSTGAFGGGTLNQLGGNNFYAYVGTQTPKFYFDDYLFEIAGNDWLTLNGGLGVNGTVNPGDPAVNVTLGINAGSYPVGTYTKTINMATNELCGAKNTYAIAVTMYVGYALTGNVYYGVTGATKPMITNTTVTLTPGPTVPTGPLGAYDIRPLADGTYALTGATTKPWGGLNSFDATLVARYLGSIVTLTDLQKRAADVNLSNSVTSFDGTLIKRRLGSIATPQWTAPNFVFDGPFPSTPLLSGMPIIISGANVTQEFRTICSGDLNSSYTPPAE